MSDCNMDHEAKKQLEWELSLSSTELISHGWYHGSLDRAAAEALLLQDGNFLVRDSSTQPGHYVLSCRHDCHYLHFVINRVVIQPDTVYERFQYQFENEPYDTIPDLITSYVGSGKPISMASGAKITTPANRAIPLLCSTSRTGTVTKSFSLNNPQWKMATGYGSGNSGNFSSHIQPKSSSSCSSPNVNYPFEMHSLSNSLHKSISSAPDQGANHTATNSSCLNCDIRLFCSCNNSETANHTANLDSKISLASKSISFGEQAALMSNVYSSLSSQDAFNHNKKQRSLSLSSNEIMQMSAQKSSSADGVIQNAGKTAVVKPESIKDEDKSDSWENVSDRAPPAKPARTQAPAYQASGSDSGNGSGDSAQSSAPGDAPAIDPHRFTAKNSKKNLDVAHAEELLMKTSILEFKQASVFDMESFRSGLLSCPDNKPLESDTLQTIKLLLRTSGPMILATYLTKIDLNLILSPNSASKSENQLDKVTGLELCLLDHGEQMRIDIIERVECIKFLIVVTILTCQNDAERADVLNDWIQLAIETKTALGNLFGFSAIMLGLCTRQVECMGTMWNILRQKHTNTAFTFEAKLRPSFKNMNDCIDSSPPNTTIPHVLPVVTLLHSISPTVPNTEWQFVEQYANHTPDYGLCVVAAQLEAARKFPSQLSLYERNAKVALAAAPQTQIQPDQSQLADLFRTEFHVKFLWGARGALAPRQERHARLNDILTTMADRYLTPPAIK